NPNPSVIVFPSTTEQVQEVVKLANQFNIAITPSGGRTGLSAGAVATNGEIVISMDKMNQILEFFPADRMVRVQAGVVTEQLQNYAEEQGMYYPVDFASAGSSQIGGNIGTNAGGIKVIKYGMTRNWVLGLTVVTGKGDILRLNKGMIKNATGYALQHLFIGGEGTGDILGPITGIIGGIGGDGDILSPITGIIGGIDGDGDILSPITGIIGGIGGIGGDLGDNPLTGIIQSGIDVLQNLESLKTGLINTGIDTIAGTIIGVFPDAEHPVGDFADLGKLLFETSRDSVNGTLEAISDLAGADLEGASGSITGVIDTLITNGSTASTIIQHIVGDDLVTENGGLLGSITTIIGGVDSGDGGLLGGLDGLISINYGDSDNSNSVDVEDILGNILGSVGSNQGIAVGEPDPTGGSLIHTISLNTVNQLTDQLLHALPTV
ncbi:FAD binding domain protein, partial [Acinetobacter baumannii 15827]